MSGIDIYATRDEHVSRCRWWKAYVPARDLSALEREEKPSGVFYARPSSSAFYDDQSVGNSFLAGKGTITVKTLDFVDDIEQEDLVEYRGALWCVESVQRSLVIGASRFSRKGRYATYLQLRGV